MTDPEDIQNEHIPPTERVFRLFFEESPEYGYILSPEGLILDINSAALNALGYEKAELIGKPLISAVYAPSSRDRAKQLFRQRRETGELRNQVLDIINRNGEERTVLLSARSVLDEDGKIKYSISIQRDITDRQRVANALKANEQKYRKLFSESNDAIFIHDLEGRIFDINEKALELFGYSRDEIEKLVVADLHSADVLADSKRAFETVMKDGSVKFETEFMKKSGDVFPAEVSSSIFEVGNQRVVQGIVRNLTERKRAESERLELEHQIQHTQKLESLGVLAGGIAHDFNNLLVGVLGNAELAADAVSSVSPAREHLTGIQTAAKRAADLCSQLLAYSGKGRFVIRPIDLNDLILDMSHLLEVSTAKSVTLKYDLADSLPAVEADATQIRQIIFNIVNNASESIGEKNGMVSVFTGEMHCDEQYFTGAFSADSTPEGAYVFIEVADNGGGMDQQTIERIFDPFFSTKFAGRGLGLAAVLGIVRGHRGVLKVCSEPDSGTTMKVLFPASEQPAVALAAAPTDTHDYRGTETVLVVDDDQTVLEVTKNMLESHGFQVQTAADGFEAIERFQTSPDTIDVVVLDLTMPRMGGEEALRGLRRIRADVPVILVSGYNEQEVSNRFVGKGLAGFIQKPFQTSTLISTLRSVLGK